MDRRSVALVLGLALALAATGCARKDSAPSGPVAPAKPEAPQAATLAMWRTQFDGHRAQWDAVLVGPESPLPETARATFPGLRFYPFDPEWRYVGDLERLRPPRFIEVPDKPGLGIDDIDDAVIGQHLQPGAAGIWQPTDHWDDEYSWDRTWS